MPKVNKLDKPGYRGKVRQCPSCDGQTFVWKYGRKKDCETCLGSGVVYQGAFCPFCGRSIQIEWKGLLICGSDYCKEQTKKSSEKPVGTMSDAYNDNYDKLFGLFS
jgi:hypothetical protein